MHTHTHHRSRIALALVALATIALGASCQSAKKPPELASQEEMAKAERIRREKALAEADKAFRAHDAAEAERRYVSAIQQYPDFGQAWNNLGVVLMAEERYLEAGEAFDRAAVLEPTDPRPPYNRGLLWFERGYLKESEPFFAEAIKRDPNYLPALRSAIRTSVLLRDTTDVTLDHIQRAMLQETDQQWRDYFERQRLLIDASLSAQRKASGTGS